MKAGIASTERREEYANGDNLGRSGKIEVVSITVQVPGRMGIRVINKKRNKGTKRIVKELSKRRSSIWGTPTHRIRDRDAGTVIGMREEYRGIRIGCVTRTD